MKLIHLLFCCFFLYITNPVNGQSNVTYTIGINYFSIQGLPNNQTYLLNNENNNYQWNNTIGGWYQYHFNPNQSLRLELNHRKIEASRYGFEIFNEESYTEWNSKLGYLHQVNFGWITSYIGAEILMIESKIDGSIWMMGLADYKINRFGIGLGAFLGIQLNIGKRLAISVETNIHYIYNSTQRTISAPFQIFTSLGGKHSKEWFLEWQPVGAFKLSFNFFNKKERTPQAPNFAMNI
jgi:hypothetical protein